MSESNHQTLMVGWPWWARFATVLGFPALVALGVLYEAHLRIGIFGSLLAQHVSETRKWGDIIRANCINAAQDNAAKDRCIYGLSEDEARSIQK